MESYPKDSSDSDEPFDFNLGSLSINDYLGETKKKKKDSNRPKKKSYSELFDTDEDDEEDSDLKLKQSLGKYATGNKVLDQVTANTMKLMQMNQLDAADRFDSLFDTENDLRLEENAELQSNLITLGRKYARENATSKEDGEITKAFSESEKKLRALYEEIGKDKADIQKDIDRMRVPGRGGKTMSDMIAVKKELHAAQVSIVKEINSMRAKQIELKMKEAQRKADEGSASNDINTNTLQSIFSSSRGILSSNMGGYSSLTGATSGIQYSEVEDDELSSGQRRVYNDLESQEATDGDKFLEYEDRNVEYVLIIDGEDHVQGIIAEDQDENMIPDYPIPHNLADLSFEIDKITMTASDSLHRNYKLRIEE